jgi:hypothetical protein
MSNSTIKFFGICDVTLQIHFLQQDFSGTSRGGGWGRAYKIENKREIQYSVVHVFTVKFGKHALVKVF